MSDNQQAILVLLWVLSLILASIFSARFGFFLGAESVYAGDVICESALSEWTCKISKDINSLGIRIVSDKFIAPLTNVFLQISLASRSVDALAMVIWANKIPNSDSYLVGLEFREIDLKKRIFLKDFFSNIEN